MPKANPVKLQVLEKIKRQYDQLIKEIRQEQQSQLSSSGRSLVFVVAFPRYPSITVRLAKTAVERGCHIVSITDSHLSSISGLGELTFHIPVGIPSFVDAYAAPLTFISALCAGVAENKPARSKAALMAFDDLIQKVEDGNPHDQSPIQYKLPHLGITIDTRVFHRKRKINPNSSFSVIG